MHANHRNTIRRTMTGLILSSLVFSFVAHADAFSDLQVKRPRVVMQAPDFTLPDSSGKMQHLSALRGRVVILNFWVTFCAPCRKELPSLQRLAEAYVRRDVVVLTVAEDPEGRKVVGPYLRQNGITLPALIDKSGTVRKQYGVNAFPMTYLIGRDGKFIGLIMGARDWYDASSQKLMDLLLATNSN